MAPEQSQETRDRIFDAAARLFAERGYAAVSMREIAEAAEISKPMLYYYFESKEGLCRALLDAGIDAMKESVARISAQGGPVVERMRQTARERYRFVRERPNLMAFYANFFHGPDESGLRDEFMVKARETVQTEADMIAEGQASRELRSDVNPMVAAIAMMGAINVHIGMQFHGHGTPMEGEFRLDDAMADMAVSLFVDGMTGARR